MTHLLANKKIVLIVTASISAYKAIELLRLFVKAGAKVKVVMSEDAKKFVTPLTFEALSNSCVLSNDTENWSNENNHIGFAKWADLVVLAPATVNTIAKLANGIADNLPSQVFVAFNGKKVIAPAANTAMFQNKVTASNILKLQEFGCIIAKTQTKLLACGDIGDGALASENEIFWLCVKELYKDNFWENRSVVISGGGTNEPIDDVRYITNASSGKMSSAIALAAYILGATVELICTHSPKDLPNDIKITNVFSSADMYENLKQSMQNSQKEKMPYLFMAAAVADFTPIKQSGKIKKSSMGENFNLTLHKNIDILSSLNKSEFKTVGFKAETDADNAYNSAKNMLVQKDLNAVALNIIGVDTEFGSDNSKLRFLTKNSETILDTADKLSLAIKLLNQAKEL